MTITRNSDNTTSLATFIYNTIREQVLSLQLCPGEKLSESKTATVFECSRIPVREAFRKLCFEGYLETQPQIGTFVSGINIEKLEQIRYIREALETKVMTDGLLNNAFVYIIPALEQNVELQEHHYKLKDYSGLHLLDDEFHLAFYKATNKEYIRHYMGINDPDYARARYISLVYDKSPEILIEQHRNILTAVKAKDVPALQRAMQDHLTNIYRVIPTCPANVQKHFLSSND